MLSLALSVAVLSSSGGLLSGYESKHVRLLDAVEVVGGVVLGQAAYAGPQSLEGLRQERDRLQEELPSLAAPIILLAVGAGLLVTAGILSGITFSLATVATVGLVVIIAVIAGLALVITGGIILGITIGRRARASRDINRLNTQIRQLEAGGGGYQPLPTGPTPPPPPPMSLLNVPEQSVVLAEF